MIGIAEDHITCSSRRATLRISERLISRIRCRVMLVSLLEDEEKGMEWNGMGAVC